MGSVCEGGGDGGSGRKRRKEGGKDECGQFDDDTDERWTRAAHRRPQNTREDTTPNPNASNAPKTPRQITNTRTQNRIRQKIRSSRNQLSLQIPSMYPSPSSSSAGKWEWGFWGRTVTRTGDDVEVVCFLEGDELGDEFGLCEAR